jgi:hypothetical protein
MITSLTKSSNTHRSRKRKQNEKLRGWINWKKREQSRKQRKPSIMRNS